MLKTFINCRQNYLDSYFSTVRLFFLVDVRLLDLHVGAVFGELLVPSV